jgi:hypothetical protein
VFIWYIFPVWVIFAKKNLANLHDRIILSAQKLFFPSISQQKRDPKSERQKEEMRFPRLGSYHKCFVFNFGKKSFLMIQNFHACVMRDVELDRGSFTIRYNIQTF